MISGDLVCRGSEWTSYRSWANDDLSVGLILDIHKVNGINKWVFVLWPDDGACIEKSRDLEVVSHSLPGR